MPAHMMDIRRELKEIQRVWNENDNNLPVGNMEFDMLYVEQDENLLKWRVVLFWGLNPGPY